MAGTMAVANNHQSANSDSASPIQDLNIAVIGARGSGKSTFVRRALGLPETSTTTNCSRRMTIDGTPYIVRFLEMTFNDVHVGDRSIIKWPETIHDFATPRMDAAVTIYDVQESLGKVPEMLSRYPAIAYHARLLTRHADRVQAHCPRHNYPLSS
jgi:energy-coupling factor transporter ATP-binding protein EcfA2